MSEPATSLPPVECAHCHKLVPHEDTNKAKSDLMGWHDPVRICKECLPVVRAEIKKRTAERAAEAAAASSAASPAPAPAPAPAAPKAQVQQAPPAKTPSPTPKPEPTPAPHAQTTPASPKAQAVNMKSPGPERNQSPGVEKAPSLPLLDTKLPPKSDGPKSPASPTTTPPRSDSPKVKGNDKDKKPKEKGSFFAKFGKKRREDSFELSGPTGFRHASHFDQNSRPEEVSAWVEKNSGPPAKGWLHLQGVRMGRMDVKRRWFELDRDAGFLAYYLDNSLKKEIGRIDMRNVANVSSIADKLEDKFFTIHIYTIEKGVRERTYVVGTQYQYNVGSWINELNNYIKSQNWPKPALQGGVEPKGAAEEEWSEEEVSDNDEPIEALSGKLPQDHKTLFSLDPEDVYQFIDGVVRDEVTRTLSENTLFRSDCDATKIIVNYLKYLEATRKHITKIINPLIKELGSITLNFEVDPTRIEETEKLEDNITRITKLSQKVLDAVFNALTGNPPEVSAVLHRLRVTVEQKYPSKGVNATGAIYFLRWVCPWLSAPEAFGFPPGKIKNRRPLLLVAKVLNKLANGVEFHDQKESFMLPFNSFIRDNIEPMNTFLDKLSKDMPTSQALSARLLETVKEPKKLTKDARRMTMAVKVSREKPVDPALQADFSGKGLTQPPTVPKPEIVQLLDLSFNKFTRLPVLPWFQLKAVQVLRLEGNQIESLDDSLGEVPTLRELHLTGNKLTQLPATIGNLQTLERLYLGNNDLRVLPAAFARLTRLEELVLAGNQLGTLPPHIGYCHSMELLDLSANQLTILPEEFSGMTRLMELNLSQNNLASLPQTIGRCTRLMRLQVDHNKLKELPISLGYCYGLAGLGGGLTLSSNPISDEVILEKARLGVDHLFRYLESRLISADYPKLPHLDLPPVAGAGSGAAAAPPAKATTPTPAPASNKQSAVPAGVQAEIDALFHETTGGLGTPGSPSPSPTSPSQAPPEKKELDQKSQILRTWCINTIGEVRAFGNKLKLDLPLCQDQESVVPLAKKILALHQASKPLRELIDISTNPVQVAMANNMASVAMYNLDCVFINVQEMQRKLNLSPDAVFVVNCARILQAMKGVIA